jgi:hypothetical protein
LEAGNGARRAVNRPDLPTALGEDHEKYSTEVFAAAKYSWKAALEGGAYPRQRSSSQPHRLFVDARSEELKRRGTFALSGETTITSRENSSKKKD